jgi:hypothetical protein
MLFGGSALIAPLIAGPLLDSSYGEWWPLVLVVILGVGALFIRGVAHHLTDAENGLSEVAPQS